MPSSLPSPAQALVLRALADLEPPWTLTGGGALVLVHLGHRSTRDLDLFFRGQSALGPLPAEVVRRLRDAGARVETLRTFPAFAQLQVVHEDGSTVVVDLVADPAPTLEEPQVAEVAGVRVLVDSPREILVNKLCTMLSRSEVRDLVDIRALAVAGEDLRRAVGDAPKKDGGFSPLTLAWLTDSMDLEAAADTGLVCDELEAFRTQIVALLAEEAGA